VFAAFQKRIGRRGGLCAPRQLRQQRGYGLAAHRTRRSAGRLVVRGLAGGAGIAAELLVAAAAAVTPRERKSREPRLLAHKTIGIHMWPIEWHQYKSN